MSADPSGCIGSQTPLAWTNGSLQGFGPQLVDNGCQTMTGVTKAGPKLGVGEVRKTAKPRDINADFDPIERVIPIRAWNYTYPIPGAAPVDTNEVNKMAHMIEAAIDKTALNKKKGEKSPKKVNDVTDKAMEGKKVPNDGPLQKVKEPKVADEKDKQLKESGKKEKISKESAAKEKTIKEPVAKVPKEDKGLKELPKKGKSPKKIDGPEPAPATQASKTDGDNEDISALDILLRAQASQGSVRSSATVTETADAAQNKNAAKPVEDSDSDSSSSSGGEDDYKFVIPDFGVDGDSPRDVEMADADQMSDVAPTEVVEYPQAVESAKKVEEKPAAKKVEEKPAAKKVEEKPAAKKVEEKPAAKKVEEKPAAKKVEEKPAAKKVEEKPAAKKVEEKPAAKKVEEKPAAKKVEEKPAAKKVEEKPFMAEKGSLRTSKVAGSPKGGSQWLLNDSSSDSSDSSEEFVFDNEAVRALAEPEAELQPEEPKKQVEEEPPAKRVKKSPKKASDVEMKSADKQPKAVTPKKVVEGSKTSSSKRRSSVATKVPDSSAKKTDDATSDSSEDFGMVVPELKGAGEKEQPEEATPKRKVRPVKTAGRPKPSVPAKPSEPVSEESEEDKGKEVGGSPAPSGRSSRRSSVAPMMGTVVSVETGLLQDHNAETLFEALQKAVNRSGGDKSQLVELLWPKNSTFAFLNTRVPKSRKSIAWLNDGKVKIGDSEVSVAKVTEKELKQKVSQEMKDARGDTTVHAGWAPEASAKEATKKPSKAAKRKRESAASAEKPTVRRDEKVYSEAVSILRSSQGPVAKGSFMHNAIADLLEKKVSEAKKCEFELSQGDEGADPQVTVKRADGTSEVWTASRVAEKKNARVNSKRRKSKDGKSAAKKQSVGAAVVDA